MIALEDIKDTSRKRQQIQTINRETLLKYKNYRHLTFPAEVICTIKKLKIKKSFRGGRGKGRRRIWDMNKGIHFNVLRLLPDEDHIQRYKKYSDRHCKLSVS